MWKKKSRVVATTRQLQLPLLVRVRGSQDLIRHETSQDAHIPIEFSKYAPFVAEKQQESVLSPHNQSILQEENRQV